jgi:hypothetical protein
MAAAREPARRARQQDTRPLGTLRTKSARGRVQTCGVGRPEIPSDDAGPVLSRAFRFTTTTITHTLPSFPQADEMGQDALELAVPWTATLARAVADGHRVHAAKIAGLIWPWAALQLT